MLCQMCFFSSEGQTSCIQPSLSDAHHPEEATEVLKGTILGFVSRSKMLESAVCPGKNGKNVLKGGDVVILCTVSLWNYRDVY